MKNYNLLFLLMMSLFLACKKKDPKPEPPKPEPPVVVVLPKTKAEKIDSMRLYYSKSGLYNIVTDSVWADNSGITFHVTLKDNWMSSSYDITPSNEDRIFPGALIKGNTVAKRIYEPLTGYERAPLTIYTYSPKFTISDLTLIPTSADIAAFIKTSLQVNSGTTPGGIYPGNSDSFDNYGIMAMSTGSSWDFSTLVIRKPGDKGNIKKKNGFFTQYKFTSFGISVEPPLKSYFGPGIKPSTIPDEPLVVAQVDYGRKAIIAIESDASYEQIKAAYFATIEKKASEADKKIFQDAIITISMRGFPAEDIRNIEASQGFDRLSLFAKTLEKINVFSTNDYGVPLNFICLTADGYAPVKYKFSYRLDYPLK